MKRYDRRTFILQAAGATALAATGLNANAEKPKLVESDPYPKSIGFRLETENVDQKKYPRHTVEQRRSKCQLFSGKPDDPFGPCSFYGGGLVPTNGWCRNFKVKKPKAA